jgi:hypothetical protein
MNRKNVEYAVAGALALYVVFFTRPAPYVVTSLLASPVAQVAALALVIYVGAKQSMVVAVVLALALVMSMPAREHATNMEKDAADALKKAADAPAKPAPKPAASKAKKADTSSVGAKPGPKADAKPAEPAPGANDVATSTDAKGSEKFSLMNAAPF